MSGLGCFAFHALRTDRDYVDMIGEKWLSDVIFTTVRSKADISRVRKGPTGDFQVGDLSKAINTPEINEVTVRAWIARAADRKSTLVFCADLKHVSDITATFRRHGFEAKFITGDTQKNIRGDRLDAFKRGDFPVLVNCGVFTEGTDIPNIDCVLLARPTKSRNLLVQMIGRGMRLHPGKANCHVIDMVASLEAGVVTTPTLFGLDPQELVKEATVEDLKSQRERNELELDREKHAVDAATPQQAHRPKRTITFTDYDSVYDLIDDTSGERHIRASSPLAWVMVDHNRYVLSSQDGSYLTIEHSVTDASTKFVVTYVQKMPEGFKEAYKTKSPFMRPRIIATSENIGDAVRGADTFAAQKLTWKFLHAGQAWRRSPATDGQLAFLNKLRPINDQLKADSLTKGKAGDMITKIKHGAKGRFSKMEATRRKEGRVAEKLRQVDNLRQREQVRVGPIIQ